MLSGAAMLNEQWVLALVLADHPFFNLKMLKQTTVNQFTCYWRSPSPAAPPNHKQDQESNKKNPNEGSYGRSNDRRNRKSPGPGP